MTEKCQAFQAAGSMVCKVCDLEWDAGDPDPPKCRRKHECAVCQGEAGAVRVDRFHLCDDPRCVDVAKVWISRQPDGSTYWESEARRAGGKAGGLYLQHEAKQTDLRKLTRDQYAKFIERVVTGYRKELRRQGHYSAPPF